MRLFVTEKFDALVGLQLKQDDNFMFDDIIQHFFPENAFDNKHFLMLIDNVVQKLRRNIVVFKELITDNRYGRIIAYCAELKGIVSAAIFLQGMKCLNNSFTLDMYGI